MYKWIEDLILIRLILDEITKYGTYILYTCPNFMPFNWYWGLQNNVQLFKEPYNYKQTERLKNMTFIMKLEMKTYEMVFPSNCHPLGCMYANEINVVNKCQSDLCFFFRFINVTTLDFENRRQGFLIVTLYLSMYIKIRSYYTCIY